MKKLSFFVLVFSLVAMGCSDSGSSNVIRHSDEECPKNLTGEYCRMEIETDRFGNTVSVESCWELKLETNEKGQLVFSVGDEDEQFPVDGRVHTVSFETEKANVQAYCSNGTLFSRAYNHQGELTESFKLSEDGNTLTLYSKLVVKGEEPDIETGEYQRK